MRGTDALPRLLVPHHGGPTPRPQFTFDESWNNGGKARAPEEPTLAPDAGVLERVAFRARALYRDPTRALLAWNSVVFLGASAGIVLFK